MSALEKQRADVIIFSGQSNMQGQTEALPLENDPVENAFEYRHLTGELAELKHPCGEDIGGGLLLGAHLGRGSLLPAFCREYAARTGRTTVAVHAAKGATCAFEWLEGTARFEALVEKSRGAFQRRRSALARAGFCSSGFRGRATLWPPPGRMTTPHSFDSLSGRSRES